MNFVTEKEMSTGLSSIPDLLELGWIVFGCYRNKPNTPLLSDKVNILHHKECFFRGTKINTMDTKGGRKKNINTEQIS